MLVETYGSGSKPMGSHFGVGEFTTHFSPLYGGLGCSLGLTGILTHGLFGVCLSHLCKGPRNTRVHLLAPVLHMDQHGNMKRSKGRIAQMSFGCSPGFLFSLPSANVLHAANMHSPGTSAANIPGIVFPSLASLFRHLALGWVQDWV